MLLYGVCNICAQNSATVAYNYDTNGNRISVNYILARVDNTDMVNDTEFDVLETSNDGLDYVISVYPNPTSGYLVLSSSGSYDNIGTIHIKLYSMQGNTIEERDLMPGCIEFDLSCYPAGLYFLSVVCNDERDLWKIVKK